MSKLVTMLRPAGVGKAVFGLLALLLVAGGGQSGERAAVAQAAAAKPNLVFAIADDWSWPHAGAYGDKVVKTPAFDQVAAEGVLFTRAFCMTPSCTPSRAAILTGQECHRLEEGGNLHGFLPKKFACYTDLLEAAGYHVGLTGKGWGPGNFQAGERPRNPAGPPVRSFTEFLKTVPKDKPFCYWYGSSDPHRPYEKGSGAKSGMKIEDVVVPPFLPDTPEVRSDILDYYFEVQRFDRQVGDLLAALKESGHTENTIVVITSDNGMPFPRCKTNLYDSGSHMPLAIRWPAKVKGGRKVDDFVSFTDFAPTFLEAAGVKTPAEMTGKSLLPLLTDEKARGRDKVFLERERHAQVRKGDLSYPVRAVRTPEFLYLRNFRPDRWPAGDPEMYKSVGPFGDIDGSPTKDLILDKRDDKEIQKFFQLACAKRPAEELYDLSKDPHQLNNVADQLEYAAAKQKLRAELDKWMKDTGDPRVDAKDDRWDKFPYFGQVRKIE